MESMVGRMEQGDLQKDWTKVQRSKRSLLPKRKYPADMENKSSIHWKVNNILLDMESKSSILQKNKTPPDNSDMKSILLQKNMIRQDKRNMIVLRSNKNLLDKAC